MRWAGGASCWAVMAAAGSGNESLQDVERGDQSKKRNAVNVKD